MNSDSMQEKNLRLVSEFEPTPTGWTEESVATVCDVGRGRVISEGEIKANPGAFPVYSSQTKNNGVMGLIDTFDFTGEWVTWTTDGANAGTVFHRTGKFSCTNVCGTLKNKSENLDLKFFSYHLGRVAKKYVSYIGNPKLMNDVMGRVAFALPSSGEQRKIARILTTLDNLIEKTEALIAKYQSIKQGMMHDLFTRGVDSSGQLRPTHEQAPDLYKQSELGWIPKEWDDVNVGTLFEMQLGKMLSQKSKTGINSFPYLANRNVQWGKFDLKNLPKMDFSKSERQKFSLEEGDLLVCEGGEVGRTAIWPSTSAEVYYQKAIHRLRPKDGSTLPRFMLHFMAYANHIGIFTDFTSQTSIAHLTREKFSLVPMVRPPRDEQQRLVDRLDAMDNQISKEEESLAKFSTVKSGLMQDLLTGKVRVNVE